MKHFKLPFQIGEQYDLHEFDLEYLKTVFIRKYEYIVYKYIKNDIPTLYGFKIKEIQLYYNGDILGKVVYILIMGST